MGSAVGSPMGPSTGHQAPKTDVSILGGEGSMLGLTRLPGPPAATRWEPEPLGYQELKSERTELPASRLLMATLKFSMLKHYFNTKGWFFVVFLKKRAE